MAAVNNTLTMKAAYRWSIYLRLCCHLKYLKEANNNPGEWGLWWVYGGGHSPLCWSSMALNEGPACCLWSWFIRIWRHSIVRAAWMFFFFFFWKSTRKMNPLWFSFELPISSFSPGIWLMSTSFYKARSVKLSLLILLCAPFFNTGKLAVEDLIFFLPSLWLSTTEVPDNRA